ncbi:serine/threonine protein kinase [Streptomyces hygroscopicus subsp. jinggangensis 5008]|nr:serine/threonine protein kinase [Streptomyces hygroscopicus subsp. jinggangensis 5008]AGF63873.1 serine/threonine protein kinase [Streptomyces hygroscopicus subsp. jinggangensis TL01]
MLRPTVGRAPRHHARVPDRVRGLDGKTRRRVRWLPGRDVTDLN